MAHTLAEPVATTSGRADATAVRLHFLDHLRAAVILLVIALHAAMTYMAFAPTWWYVVEPDNSLLFTGLVLLLDVPNMQAMFFIAGFFAYPSLMKHGSRGFLRQKALRIGLPWVVGVVFLAPLTTYLIPLTRGLAGSYLDFWTGDFWGVYFQQSVYWFLGMLLLLFVGFAAVVSSEPRLQDLPRTPQAPSRRLFLTFWGLMTLAYFVGAVAFGSDTWLNNFRLIVFQPSRLALYGGYFTLGIIADRRGWFRAGGFHPDLGWWGPAALISAIAYLGLRLFWPGADLVRLAAEAALFNAFCLSALLAGLAFFQRAVNRPTPVWNSLSRNAFAIYYVHPLVLYPAAYLALSAALPIGLEWALLVLFTALVSWAIGALFLTRLPGLREVF